MKRRPYPGVYNAGPVVDAGAFVRDLLDGMETSNSDCAWFLTLRRTPDDISEFLDIFNVPFCYADSVQLADVKDTLQEFETPLELNSNIIENLEKSTRGQGVNVNWKRARSVVVTASHMGSIVKRQKLELDALVKAIMYPTFIGGVKSRNYGNKMETKARQDYARWHIENCDAGVVVEDRGLIVSLDNPFLGASIDGHVQGGKCGEGIVEIKCPYGSKQKEWRNMTPSECAASSNFSCTLDEDKLRLKQYHQYYVSGSMADGCMSAAMGA